jgi:hypothetical protein
MSSTETSEAVERGLADEIAGAEAALAAETARYTRAHAAAREAGISLFRVMEAATAASRAVLDAARGTRKTVNNRKA